MNTVTNSPFKIVARHLGPILSLEEEITKRNQNLIFARNGTGKSFLSRAFRYLDRHGQGLAIDDAINALISDESPTQTGSFTFSRGDQELGRLDLNRPDSSATAQLAEMIFHVFSEDFIHDELRQREFEIDGEIDTEIAIDSDNIRIREATEALEKAQDAENLAFSELSTRFSTDQSDKLGSQISVNKQLGAYRALDLKSLIEKTDDRPQAPQRTFASVIADLNQLKSIPENPVFPDQVNAQIGLQIDVSALASSLQKVTSPSTVSDVIKTKIEEDHEFFKQGADKFSKCDDNTCPFCEQSVNSGRPKELIEAYLAYFADAEETHKVEIRKFLREFSSYLSSIEKIEKAITQRRSDFDALKAYLPSTSNWQLEDLGRCFETLKGMVSEHQKALIEKESALELSKVLPNSDIHKQISEIEETNATNNSLVKKLNKAIDLRDRERLKLHREACKLFEINFALKNWDKIDEFKQLSRSSVACNYKLSEFERANPSKMAKDRVADCFEMLLKEFFADKYVFDKETFTLKRGDHEMTRGAHRTLSDGEKTALAFCYFVASIHRKVKSNSDYQNLFLVFDDPVNSMSYDFVFTIAQTLKNLSLSQTGDISVNPKVSDPQRRRPAMIVFTHSSYFFNVAVNNRMVKDDAAFCLTCVDGAHGITRLDTYISPFQEHLRDILAVAKLEREANHTTGNSVRSVLEAVGRFCQPDKKSLSDFIIYLCEKKDFPIKSVLINSLCHGSYYEETPSPEDLILACGEAVEVVGKFAPGQLEVLTS